MQLQANFSCFKYIKADKMEVMRLVVQTRVFLIAFVFLLLSVYYAAPFFYAPRDFQTTRNYIFATTKSSHPSYAMSVEQKDARAKILSQYLKEKNSPLKDYSDKIVFEADKNKLDFRLLTAIARQESNLCKFAPDETFNCWGWGIHKRGTLGFDSFDHAIEVVSLGIKEKYIDYGLTTPEQIMKKYTPSSNGSWANAVNQFMDELR